MLHFTMLGSHLWSCGLSTCTGSSFLEEHFHNLYSSLDETIGLWTVKTSCHMDETRSAGIMQK